MGSGDLLGGRYRLGPVIGVGGSGSVHRAWDDVLGRAVAVKMLRADAVRADVDHLRREVELLRAVRHANLVEVLGAGSDDGVARAWFAMELVDGPDLRTILATRGPMSGASVQRLLRGVLGALGAMHAAGLVHRDVTPANILLTADPFAAWDVKLTDFGIARRVAAARTTEGGRVIGTAAYLSPEQLAEGPVGPAVDVYALGLVAIEALTGEVPFPGTAIESAAARLLRPPTLPPGLATAWRDLLAAATAVRPEDRCTVNELALAAQDLPEDAGLAPGHGTAREPASATLPRTLPMPAATTAVVPAERTRRRTRPRPVLLVAMSAVVLIAGSTAAFTAGSSTSTLPDRRAAAPTARSTPRPTAVTSTDADPSSSRAAPAGPEVQPPPAAPPDHGGDPANADVHASAPEAQTDPAAAGPAVSGHDGPASTP